MKFDKMDVAELMADESFINYCRRSSPQDVAFWEAYVNEHPDRRVVVEHAKEKYIQLFNAIGEADLEEQVRRLRNRIDAMEVSNPAPVVPIERFEKDTGKRNWLPKIAAAAVLISGAFFAVKYFTSKTTTNKSFQAAYGERKNIQLPDGTDVTLNGGSKISIKENFGKASRDVFLEGEAFFDVKHNAKQPFIVHTEAIDVKALGTAFNVKAYADERITEAALIRGLVEVTLKENNNKTMLLYPNQKIKWEQPQTAGTSSIAVKPADTVLLPDSLVKKISVSEQGNIREIAWKDNKLVFEDQTFEDISVLLERWYDVDIDFTDNNIRYYRFTGIYEKEDINTVLEFLKESKKFNYKIQPGDPLKISLSQ